MEFWDSPSSLKHTPTNLSTLLMQRKWGKIACAEILSMLIVHKVTLHVYAAFVKCSPKSILKWSMHVNLFFLVIWTKHSMRSQQTQKGWASLLMVWLLLHLFMLSAGISLIHVNKAWWMMVFIFRFTWQSMNGTDVFSKGSYPTGYRLWKICSSLFHSDVTLWGWWDIKIQDLT